MPRTTQKSKTPTSSKSNRIVRLLKKKKSSKMNELDERQAPTIAHRKSAPFMMPKHALHMTHNDGCPDSSASEREDSHRSYSHQSYTSNKSFSHHFLRHSASVRDRRSIEKLYSNHPNTNTRTVPPPPPNNKSAAKSAYDRNININIDINKRNMLRSKLRYMKEDSLNSAPGTPITPQSPAERFISHLPEHSIESKINMKQLLYEMIDMKRQIKFLKKDVKHLKTENDLCHRRISFLEQMVDNHAVQSYPTYAQTQTQPPPPKHMDGVYDNNHNNEMICDHDEDEMERKLRELSSKLEKANVFSSEYRRLEYELDKLIQQQDDDRSESNKTTKYYDEIDENKHSEYTDATVITREPQTTEEAVEKQLCSPKRFYCSESDTDDTDEDVKEKEEVKQVRYIDSRSMSGVRSSYTLSRRRTKQNLSQQIPVYEMNKNGVDGDSYDKHNHHQNERKPSNMSVEFVD